MSLSFDLLAQHGLARRGRIGTAHGTVETPAFMPIGTAGTVKAMMPQSVAETGAEMILGNTYHLMLRPGAERVATLGGLHKFMNWPRPILTDSGGFQVFSLAEMRKIDEDGVTFKSHIDGSMHRFTPEKSIEIQQNLGADIIMAFDECAPPYNREYNQRAVRRTHAWAERSLAAKTRPDQALFGIVQGGVFPDLREQSAEFIASLGFPGHAIGGLSVGETKEEMNAMLEVVNAILPEEKPRYLMGVGSPEDLINGIQRGVDIFDCVLPTRLARHTAAMTRTGRINLMNKINARDPRPIDEDCGCYTCRNFSRAYLRHLIIAKEMLASTLISIHNLYSLLQLVRDARQAILDGTFDAFAAHFLENYQRIQAEEA